jgi:hypothetical protein
MTLETELLAIERQGWEALTGLGGRAFYADLLASDGEMVFPGMRLDRETALASIPEGVASWDGFDLDDVRVVPLGEGGAAITYRATARRGDDPPYVATMTSVYAHQDGRWRLVLHQQTPELSQG